MDSVFLSARFPRRRLEYLLILPAILLTALTMRPAVAYARVAWAYGIDWRRPPYNGLYQDLYPCAGYSNQYLSKWYTTYKTNEKWAVDVFNTMSTGGADVVTINTHGDAGLMMLYHSVPKKWTDSYGTFTSHISMLTSNFTYPYPYKTGISGSDGEEVVNHWRWVSNLSPAQHLELANYVGCYTGTLPGSGKGILTASVDRGVDCAVGFKTAMNMWIWCPWPFYAYTQADWNRSYMQHLAGGWTVANSLEHAESDMVTLYGAPQGFDSHIYAGNGAIVLPVHP